MMATYRDGDVAGGQAGAVVHRDVFGQFVEDLGHGNCAGLVRGDRSGRRVVRLGTRRVKVMMTPGKAVRLRGNGLARA